MSRRLHSFTLTIEASEEVQKMRQGTKSNQVSVAIMKYANDYHLSPTGVKYWNEKVSFLQGVISERNQKLQEVASRGGVKHHLAELLRCLSPFRLRKRE